MSKMERAKQFMPFAALHGYDEAIKKKEFPPQKRRELGEEDAARLNETVLALKKGDVVEAEYYSVDRYIKIQGAITAIDLVMRYIRVIKTEIKFDDLYAVKILL